MGPVTLFICLGFIVSFIFMIVDRRSDEPRIRRYIESRKGQILDIQRHRDGRDVLGLLIEDPDRRYKVRYRDKFGNEHEALAHTSLGNGVYWDKDDVTQHAENGDLTQLQQENDELKEELARIKKNHAFDVELLQGQMRRLTTELSRLRRQA